MTNLVKWTSAITFGVQGYKLMDVEGTKRDKERNRGAGPRGRLYVQCIWVQVSTRGISHAYDHTLHVCAMVLEF